MISPSGLTFFGLTSNYRTGLFTQIHNIVFHGKGGYDWHTVYNMPIWLRKFTFKKLKSFYEEKDLAQKKAAKGNNTQIDLNNPQSSVPPKTIQPPSYVTKRSKK